MWKNAPRHLPLPKGPFAPGCFDWMSDFGATSTFVRVYYPTALLNKLNDPTKWFLWSTHPKYIEGFAKLTNLWGSLIRMAVWYYGGEPLVPCMWQEPPAKQKMPVIVLSHGFGATRFISSNLATELASFGFFVASIEHKDTSAAATYYYDSPESLKNDQRTWIEHVRMQLGQPNHYEIRNAQIHNRLTEIKKLLDLLQDVNAGSAENILPSAVSLREFEGILDLDKISMMGHSFGGATTLLTISNDDRIKCGVILDCWMYPIKNEPLNFKVPVLFINSQTFHIESNLQAIEKLVNNRPENRELVTIKHSTHETQTDTPHIMGYWLNWFMYKLDPETGSNINNYLTLDFLKKYIGLGDDEQEETRRRYLSMHEKDYVQGGVRYGARPINKL
ncbi:Platelet-activating factor acetylhydrolase, isoform II [Nesidiocoris tenuis]|uniref:1-alkyl-2-acetylglycerophosphocholine esterase n=1 Tax=Nesidiocoris tenuis TaxID=355587 RepID=A0ABN7AP30_9HEMI|nr:Platelet-activating factor acetylhydrolase, isoform II [Nesidiocoris tenuis]